jgi:hypothetical protein
MKKTAESAYTDMMMNLAKSTSAIPLHLQGATGALAWWQGEESLLAKSSIAGPQEEAPSEEESDEDETEDPNMKDTRKPSSASTDVHGGDAAEEEEGEDAEEGDEAEKGEPAGTPMEKALAELSRVSDSLMKSHSEFEVGDWVGLHPGTGAFMQGAKFGVVKKVGSKKVHVDLHVSGKSTGKVVGFSPDRLLAQEQPMEKGKLDSYAARAGFHSAPAPITPGNFKEALMNSKPQGSTAKPTKLDTALEKLKDATKRMSSKPDDRSDLSKAMTDLDGLSRGR